MNERPQSNLNLKKRNTSLSVTKQSIKDAGIQMFSPSLLLTPVSPKEGFKEDVISDKQLKLKAQNIIDKHSQITNIIYNNSKRIQDNSLRIDE